MNKPPKKFSEEEKKEIRRLRPPFIAEKGIERNERQDFNNQSFTKIEDFSGLYFHIWKISDLAYQKEHWGKYGQWGDNYGETTLEFSMDSEAVLDTSDYAVEMTPKQREMLQKLRDMVFEYDTDESNPESRYGENDQAIINDPKWQEITKYARLVYEELSGDDLDAWEKERAQRDAQDAC